MKTKFVARKYSVYTLRLLASSTKMISFSNDFGERSITLCTVRISVDQASSWKTIITELDGSLSILNFFSLHLWNIINCCCYYNVRWPHKKTNIVTVFYGRPAATCLTVSDRWPSGWTCWSCRVFASEKTCVAVWRRASRLDLPWVSGRTCFDWATLR